MYLLKIDRRLISISALVANTIEYEHLSDYHRVEPKLIIFSLPLRKAVIHSLIMVYITLYHKP